MTNPASAAAGKRPFLPIALLLLLVALGGVFIYGFTAKETPAWVSFLLPSSRYDNTGKNRTPESMRTPPPAATPQTPKPLESALERQETLIEPPPPARNATVAAPLPESAGEAEKTALQAVIEATAAPAPEPVPAAGGADAANHAENAEQSGDASEENGAESVAVVFYAKAAIEEKGTVARGSIDASAQSAGGTASPGKQSPGARDGMVTEAFIADMAGFLAENYWPSGAHPLARTHGISTASLKWANMRYGGQLRGFSVDHSRLAAERRRVMDYLFMPSMLRSLYALHEDSFFSRLEAAVAARSTGPLRLPLTNGQAAECFGIYADMAGGLAGAVRSYRQAPGIRAQIAAYAAASTRANAAFARFSDSLEQNSAGKAEFARDYQEAVVLREQQKENVASAMRLNGPTAGLDSDTLVYAAMWLDRRGGGKKAAMDELAAILGKASLRLAQLSAKYAALPQAEEAGSGGGASSAVSTGLAGDAL